MWKKTNHPHHYKAEIQYHIVFCTKFRLPFLKDKHEFVIDNINDTVHKYDWKLNDIALWNDHIHLVIEAWPKYSPEQITKLIKQHLAYYLVEEYEDIRNKYLWWTKQVFSSWYFVSTLWKISQHTLEEYLHNHEH